MSGMINRNDLAGLIPEPVSREIFQGVVEQSAVLKAGRKLPNMTSKTQSINVLDMLPMAYWVEGDTGYKETGAQAWEKKRLYAEELAVIIPIPEAVLADTNYDIWGEVKPRIVEAMGRRIDEAILFGIGKPSTWRKSIVDTAKDAGNPSGEGRSRAELDLPGPQMKLAEAVLASNANTAVVLFNGRPLVLTELAEKAPALLEMWYPGTEAGNALARLLWGESNPSGKLSTGLPRSVGQYPMPYNRMNTGRPKPGPDNQPVPFSSCYLDMPNLPLYSFGYGLSYTDFIYEGMRLGRKSIGWTDELHVTVTVRNNGLRTGKETVQLYMRDPVASVVRPVQQLIDYRKIELKPGETKDVSFIVREEQLRFRDIDGNEVSEPGEFRLFTGYADHPICTESFTLRR